MREQPLLEERLDDAEVVEAEGGAAGEQQRGAPEDLVGDLEALELGCVVEAGRLGVDEPLEGRLALGEEGLDEVLGPAERDLVQLGGR